MDMARDLVALHKSMKSDPSRGNWENLWHEVMHFTLPDKDRIYDWKSGINGTDEYGKLYDASPAHFNELLASAFHGMLTNPATFWFGLTTGLRDVDRVPAVRAYLQKFSRRIHGVLNNSNFHTEIHETYLDLGSPGTSVLLIDEDDEDVVRFRSEPVYKYYLKEDYKGNVVIVTCEMKRTISQIIDEYGEKSLPEEIRRDLKNNMDKDFTVIQVIMTAKEAKKRGFKVRRKKVVSYYVLEKTEHLLKESGFSTWPMATPRFMKWSNEVYGRSPSMKGLPDIKMINAMMQTTIRSGQKIVDPPLLYPDDGVLGRINTTPGGLTPYRSGTKDEIKPLLTGGNPGLGLDMINDVRERVKQAFYIDQLQLREGPQMTATEVNQRTEEHLRLLGPILGRLHHELLKPMIARVIDIMKKRKQIPEDIPPELDEIDLEVHFTSQIAKAQRMGEAQGLNAFMEITGGIMQFAPEVVDLIDTEALVRLNADIYGASEEIFRKPDEVEQIREQRAEQQQKEQQQQDDLAAAETVQKVGPTLQQQG